MTQAFTTSVRVDTAAVADADDTAILNLFQVIAINLVCFFALTGLAILFGVSWWISVLIGWVGASVATLPVTALIVLLWPVASHEVAAANTAAPIVPVDAHVRMWAEDLEDELDAAFLAAARPGPKTPMGWEADIESHADALFQQAMDIAVNRKAA
jgi:hypothetical protein